MLLHQLLPLITSWGYMSNRPQRAAKAVEEAASASSSLKVRREAEVDVRHKLNGVEGQRDSQAGLYTAADCSWRGCRPVAPSPPKTP